MRTILNGLLIALAISLGYTIAPTAAQSTPNNGVTGIAEESLLARYHPDFASVCAIDLAETVLAIAQTADLYLIYAGGDSCEGSVWLPVDAAIAWSDADGLARLPEVDRPTATPLVEVEDYEALCAAAPEAELAGIDATTIESIYIPGGFSWFTPRYLATEDTPPDAIVCIETIQESRGICVSLNVRVERFQDETIVRLVSYPDGAIIAGERFDGGFPDDCPNAASEEYSINGTPVERTTWAAWLLNRLGAGGGTERLRTRTIVPRLNARAESNTSSEILGILEADTPVNFIARNEAGTWGVALLPDMTQAWLFTDFVNIAAQTDFDNLPIVSGPANEVEVTLP